jgi:hypothetical protein
VLTKFSDKVGDEIGDKIVTVLVTTLVLTKLGDEFVTKFGYHQVCHQIW